MFVILSVYLLIFCACSEKFPSAKESETLVNSGTMKEETSSDMADDIPLTEKEKASYSLNETETEPEEESKTYFVTDGVIHLPMDRF